MTHKEILAKAMQKAIDRGWLNNTCKITLPDAALSLDDNQIRSMIFDHDFAKALWGESKPVNYGKVDAGGRKRFGQPMSIGWQYHLQNMVISDDPIAYLGANI